MYIILCSTRSEQINTMKLSIDDKKKSIYYMTINLIINITNIYTLITSTYLYNLNN